MVKTYSEVIKLPRFEDRFEYLKLSGKVGDTTFGGNRYLNQLLYQCREWKTTKRDIILRDDGCDLAHPNFEIRGHAIYIHHINPITIDDILERKDCVFDPENLICVSFQTHNAIHYGNGNYGKEKIFVERKPHDTCPWRV